MAYSAVPTTWLGKGYSLSSGVISLTNASDGGVSIGDFTAVAATDVITLSTHGLKVGDAVKVSTTTTLPGGLSADTVYYVLTVPSADTLTLSETLNGGTLDITDTGTGTHTMLAIALPELTDAEANASTGDIRKIYFALAEAIYQSWNNTATANRPTKMTIARSSSINESTGIATKTYVLTFATGVISQEVTPES